MALDVEGVVAVTVVVDNFSKARAASVAGEDGASGGGRPGGKGKFVDGAFDGAFGIPVNSKKSIVSTVEPVESVTIATVLVISPLDTGKATGPTGSIILGEGTMVTTDEVDSTGDTECASGSSGCIINSLIGSVGAEVSVVALLIWEESTDILATNC
jgi:hypothetical protein